MKIEIKDNWDGTCNLVVDDEVVMGRRTREACIEGQSYVETQAAIRTLNDQKLMTAYLCTVCDEVTPMCPECGRCMKHDACDHKPVDNPPADV